MICQPRDESLPHRSRLPVGIGHLPVRCLPAVVRATRTVSSPAAVEREVWHETLAGGSERDWGVDRVLDGRLRCNRQPRTRGTCTTPGHREVQLTNATRKPWNATR